MMDVIFSVLFFDIILGIILGIVAILSLERCDRDDFVAIEIEVTDYKYYRL